ncbi:hypothetical protein [Streptomyces xantholiticus]|uniref:Uncharacterized protein n=1 Tax=Streptomyces xantholiticus TaxID=68285 RepID=A0ABV1UZA6_9ACTN
MNLRRPWKLLTDRLPPELTGLGARIAWIADAGPSARPPARWTGTPGFRPPRACAPCTTERHDTAMLRMIDQVAARPHLLRMTALDDSPPPTSTSTRLLQSSTRPHGRGGGALGHVLLTAEKSGDA